MNTGRQDFRISFCEAGLDVSLWNRTEDS